MIKRRKMKLSKRGIYLQDKELQKTDFKVGGHYRFILDVKSKKVIILPSDNEKDNTISKRVVKDEIKPVLDIRRKEVQTLFSSCEYLQVTINEDKIIVEGYNKAKTSFINKALGFIKNIKNKKIVDITQILEVKKKFEVVLSIDQLQKVVGSSYQQISFENLFDEDIPSNYKKGIRKSLDNLQIPLKVVSTFVGAGLLDKGFIDSGYDIIWSCDIDKDACTTYRHNIGDHVVCDSITNIDKSAIPLAPIVIGGSPCQGFSSENRISNYLDNPKNLLVREYIDTVKANKECKVFVLENVPQILTAGDGRFKKEIYESLHDFEISSGVLSAKDFGVAQTRDRAIFIGSKIGRIDLPKVKIHECRTVRQALKGLTKTTPNQLDYSIPKSITLERIKCVPQGGNVFSIPEEIRPKGKHSDVYKRLEWDKPSITIVNPRKAMLLHPEENRILSIRECLRLQGAPDDYILYGSLSSKQQQVANAVPVPMARAIADTIKEAIYSFNIKNKLALSI